MEEGYLDFSNRTPHLAFRTLHLGVGGLGREAQREY